MSSENNNLFPNKPLLGEVLLKRDVISCEQLTQALELQKNEGVLLGEIFVRLGFIEEQDIVIALMIQYNFPYIAIDKYPLDQTIIQLISAEEARHHHVIPLDRVGNILSIVMADPLNTSTKAELHRITNCKITPFIATKTEIDNAIKQWYTAV